MEYLLFNYGYILGKMNLNNSDECSFFRDEIGGNADAGGGFATTAPTASRTQTQVDSVILSEWNSFDYEAEIVISKGMKLNIGTVESQYTLARELLAGGAEQILLPKNWDLNWIKNIRCME